MVPSLEQQQQNGNRMKCYYTSTISIELVFFPTIFSYAFILEESHI